MTITAQLAFHRYGNGQNRAALALEPGYFDQAHFVRAFRVLTGMTPVAYQQTLLQKKARAGKAKERI